jgi:hypothetical protein
MNTLIDMLKEIMGSYVKRHDELIEDCPLSINLYGRIQGLEQAIKLLQSQRELVVLSPERYKELLDAEIKHDKQVKQPEINGNNPIAYS